MTVPRIGVSLPQFGPYAGPDGVVTVAQAAERLGFHSVSVNERLLLPLRPDWDNGAKLPDSYVWDPIELLTWAAAHTSRIRLATGIVNAIFQPPIILARRLATLDQLSEGRLDAGIGQGGGGTPETGFRIPEEFVAAGVPESRCGAGFEEHINAMRACWGPDPVKFRGKYYEIPLSMVGPKPYGTTMPLFVGANVKKSVERAARLGAGLITVGLPGHWHNTKSQIDWYKNAGGKEGIVVNAMQFYVGEITEQVFTDAILADLGKVSELGADEMHFTLNIATVPPDRQVELLEALAAKL